MSLPAYSMGRKKTDGYSTKIPATHKQSQWEPQLLYYGGEDHYFLLEMHV